MAASAGNRLSGETSPYLLQHAANPVDWYPWGDAAFDRARSENRPVLLSVGYSACHWCHVMERESFEDANIAALMNRFFVCIKVDREERPDIDSIYMAAVQAMTGQGGWPMTVFLTPGGEPFYGGTYYPPEDRYGHPGFIRVLNAVAEAWAARPDELNAMAAELTAALSGASTPEEPGDARSAGPDVLNIAIETLKPLFDSKFGGFGTAPKFPQAPTLDLLVRAAPQNPTAASMLQLTLDRMAAGGIYDHVGGGFHRYSTDREWLAPHFEKMLYDNAQLALCYARAGAQLQQPRYLLTAQATLDYLLREMCSPEGAFYSSQDADSEGEEGRFYVWSLEAAADALEPDELERIQQSYTLTRAGNWEGTNILTLRQPESLSAHGELLGKMRSVRARRVPPATDDKALSSWNGLALAALAECAGLCGRADYLPAATRTAEFLANSMTWRDDAGYLRLWHTWRGGAARINGFLEDYAFVARGMLALYEAAGESRWLNMAGDLATTLLAQFRNEAGDVLFDTSHDAPPLLHRPVSREDNAVPAGCSVAIETLLRLAAVHDDDAMRQAALRILAPLSGDAAKMAYGHGRLLCALDDSMGDMTTIVLCGTPADPTAAALRTFAWQLATQRRVLVSRLPDDPNAPGLPLLEGRGPVDGKPAAFVCTGRVCGLPVTDAGELAEALRGLR